MLSTGFLPPPPRICSSCPLFLRYSGTNCEDVACVCVCALLHASSDSCMCALLLTCARHPWRWACTSSSRRAHAPSTEGRKEKRNFTCKHSNENRKLVEEVKYPLKRHHTQPHFDHTNTRAPDVRTQIEPSPLPPCIFNTSR
jgi:hypothetical protein